MKRMQKNQTTHGAVIGLVPTDEFIDELSTKETVVKILKLWGKAEANDLIVTVETS